MFNVVLEIQKCVSVLFSGTTCAWQVHRGHVNVLFGSGPKQFEPYWGKFWRRSMAGLWPGAKVRNGSTIASRTKNPGPPVGTPCCRCAGGPIYCMPNTSNSRRWPASLVDAVGLHQL